MPIEDKVSIKILASIKLERLPHSNNWILFTTHYSLLLDRSFQNPIKQYVTKYPTINSSSLYSRNHPRMQPYHAEHPRNALKDDVAVPCNYSTHTFPHKCNNFIVQLAANRYILQNSHSTSILQPSLLALLQCSLPSMGGGDTLSIGHWCPALGTNKSLTMTGPSSTRSSSLLLAAGHPVNNRMVISLHQGLALLANCTILQIFPSWCCWYCCCYYYCTSQSVTSGQGRSRYLSNDIHPIQSTLQCTRDFSLLSVQWLMMSGRFNEPTT